jgi:predicted N-acetyltransferase YhbS
MKRGIEAAKAAGWQAIILVGDAPYYARVGFSRLPPGHVTFPGPVNPARILGLSLERGAAQMLEGPVTRARIDNPNCAGGAPSAACA